jgi:hypothetical protein
MTVELELVSAELVAEIARNSDIDPRTVPCRSSNLKHMARSPLHYYDAVQLGRDDTLAMRLGRGAHAIVLGEPVVLYPGKARRGKDYDRWRADQDPRAEILIRSEWDRAQGVGNAIRRHRDASRILFTDTVLEQTIAWEWLGKKCTSRPDSRRPDGRVIADLKTTQDASPEKFKRDALHRCYDAQLSFYDQASEYETGRQADELYAVAVESKRPYAVTVLRLTDEVRERGRKMCRLWMEQLLVCEAANHWPSYVDHIVDLDVPADAGELTLTIDGEEFDFDGDNR